MQASAEARGLLPEDIEVEITELREGRYRVVVQDNGPGIVRAQLPKIFGQLLYGSKFHSLKQSRGQQGIGISAAGMYGQLKTGKPVVIADVPYPGQDVPECLADNLKDIRPCAVSPHNRVSGGSPARERQAARSSGGVLLDFNDLICGGQGRCPVVRDDIIVFRDHHHLTATFFGDPVDEAGDFFLNEKEYALWEGRLWIPVETTMFPPCCCTPL